MPAVEPFLRDLVFPEAPRWHDGCLWLSDIFGQRVIRSTPDGRVATIAHLDDRPSGLGFLANGDVLVVGMQKKAVWRIDRDGGIHRHADLAPYCTRWPNDMAVDAGGRAWVGAIDEDHSGRQVLVRPDGTTAIAHPDIHAPNGPALTRDGRLVVAATRSEALFAFHIADDGRLVDRHVYARVPGVMPDGLCLDAEGAVWSSNLEGAEFIRVLEGGRITHRVALPAKRLATACVLGGTRLYLCSAQRPADPASESYVGFVDVVDVEVPGP